ncbi:MAG: DUF4252 domain-containing protein [Prevotellaceae bacterium]|jgi:hypothetical protein|nr:DUF4252 domain-containing protein [Prevotellaceae bacterium]
MKKITVLVVALLLTAITTQAQGIEKLLEKYSNDSRFTYVSLGSGMIQLGLSFIGSELDAIGNDVKDELSKIKGLKVLTLESEAEKTIASVMNELNCIIKKDPKAELIIETRDKKEITKIYMTGEGFLIASTEPDELSIVFFSGSVTKKLVQAIASGINKK